MQRSTGQFSFAAQIERSIFYQIVSIYEWLGFTSATYRTYISGLQCGVIVALSVMKQGDRGG